MNEPPDAPACLMSLLPDVSCGSFSTEAAGSAARPTSASPRKLTSGPNKKLVANGKLAKDWIAAYYKYYEAH